MNDNRESKSGASADLPEDHAGGVQHEDVVPEPGAADSGSGGSVERRATAAKHADHDSEDSRSSEEARDEEAVVAELIEQVAELNETITLLSEAFSGPIPQAKDLAEYPPAIQERILRMAEAPRTDESERRTLTIRAGIEQARRSTWVQVSLFGVCLTLSTISFWVFKDWIAGGVFIGLPVLNFIAGIRWNIRRGKRPPDDE